MLQHLHPPLRRVHVTLKAKAVSRDKGAIILHIFLPTGRGGSTVGTEGASVSIIIFHIICDGESLVVKNAPDPVLLYVVPAVCWPIS
jgi:hypothetical protein